VGENRVQELLEKDAAGAYEGIPLHFIGHLQKNKINKLIKASKAEPDCPGVTLVQSIDSIELAEAVSVRAGQLGIRQPVLIQVNIGLEATKSGFHPNNLQNTLKSLEALRGIQVSGLMCIPPAGNTASFEAMRRLFDKAKGYAKHDMEYLSMGMSGDYEEAVKAGANIVRVGSALFGRRAAAPNQGG
jgi:hypothetical protein